MEPKEIRVTCPYYINSDRLVDLLASATDGYGKTEEVEKTVTSTQRKSRGLKGTFKKSIFSVSAEGNKATEEEKKETKKATQIHTGASLLNKTIKEIEINDLTVPTNSQERFECGDIVKFTGIISQDKLGAEDYITFGFEAEAGVATEKNMESDLDKKKSWRREEQKKVNLIITCIAVVSELLAFFSLIYGFINQLSMIYVASFILTMILLPMVFLTAQQYILHSKKDDGLSDHMAIKKNRKKAYEGTRIKILYDENARNSSNKNRWDCNLYFVGELYDDYLYQSGLKDFLGRKVSCIGIIKHIEEHESPYAIYGEVEIITIYA